MPAPKKALEEIAQDRHTAWCESHLTIRKDGIDGECNCHVGIAKAAIPVAELHQKAVDMLGEIVTYLREDGEIEFDSQIYNDAVDIITQLEALK